MTIKAGDNMFANHLNELSKEILIEHIYECGWDNLSLVSMYNTPGCKELLRRLEAYDHYKFFHQSNGSKMVQPFGIDQKESKND